MNALEQIGMPYLFKLKQTSKVKGLIALVDQANEWIAHRDGWQYAEKNLLLSGWTRSRRVIVARRLHSKPAQQKSGKTLGDGFLPLEIIEPDQCRYEYAAYVTDLEISTCEAGAHYRPRADNENCYDEMKNQWGWAGFTVRDRARSDLMANLVALVYNWWSLYIKFVDQEVAREAITSRDLYLNHVGCSSTHRSTQTIRLYCDHALAKSIEAKLTAAAGLLKCWVRETAEQLNPVPMLSRIIDHILTNHQTLGAPPTAPPLLPNA